MSVRREDLQNPERGLEVTTREAGAAPRREDSAARRELKRRLDEARKLEPVARHWWESWHRGRVAAVDALESDGDITKARAIQVPEAIACADCFRKGRDAVIALFEGS